MKPESYDERRVLEEYAMAIWLDDDAHPADREKAKCRLVADERGVDWTLLTVAERRLLLWLLGRAGLERTAAPSAREQLETAMQIAQGYWEAYVAECERTGGKPPSPVYAFRSTVIEPSARPELAELADGPESPPVEKPTPIATARTRRKRRAKGAT